MKLLWMLTERGLALQRYYVAMRKCRLVWVNDKNDDWFIKKINAERIALYDKLMSESRREMQKEMRAYRK